MNISSVKKLKQASFFRFCLSGAIFTVLGPSLFWLCYPMGPLRAVVIAELAVHGVRFLAFKKLVFPPSRGYHVNLPRYLASALPVSIAGFVTVAVLKSTLDRNLLTLGTTVVSVLVGFAWSRYIYARPGIGIRKDPSQTTVL